MLSHQQETKFTESLHEVPKGILEGAAVPQWLLGIALDRVLLQRKQLLLPNFEAQPLPDVLLDFPLVLHWACRILLTFGTL